MEDLRDSVYSGDSDDYPEPPLYVQTSPIISMGPSDLHRLSEQFQKIRTKERPKKSSDRQPGLIMETSHNEYLSKASTQREKHPTPVGLLSHQTAPLHGLHRTKPPDDYTPTPSHQGRKDTSPDDIPIRQPYSTAYLIPPYSRTSGIPRRPTSDPPPRFPPPLLAPLLPPYRTPPPHTTPKATQPEYRHPDKQPLIQGQTT